MTDNIQDAKKAIKNHMKFLESLKGHIDARKEPYMSRAMFAAWCLKQYINDNLVEDIEKSMKESTKGA